MAPKWNVSCLSPFFPFSLFFLLENLGDEGSTLRKTVAGIEKAVDIGQKIGRTYNKIAPWVGLPSVPKILLGKDEGKS